MRRIDEPQRVHKSGCLYFAFLTNFEVGIIASFTVKNASFQNSYNSNLPTNLSP